MSAGRFEWSSGDAATGTCGTDKKSSIGNIIICVPPFFPRVFPLHFAVLVSLDRDFFSFDLMFSTVLPLRQQPTSAHCGGDGTILLLC